MRKFAGPKAPGACLCLAIACLYFVIFSFPAVAQELPGTINGRVFTSDDKPAAYVTIQLKQSGMPKKATSTDEEGRFSLRNVAAGDYELEISLVGATPISQTVVVRDNQATTVALQLNLSAKQLEEVIVTGNRNNKYASRESDYVAKMPLRNLENPQVYSILTKELLADELVTDMQGALQNVAAGAVQQSPDHTAYIMLRGFESYGLLRNGVSTGQFVDNTDPVNLEKIEILKGPSATLFGSTISSYGGVLNRVTKKPFDSFGGEIGYSTGQWGLNRFTADVNTPLNKDKTALLRINAASHQEGSFQDAGSQRSWIVAPSLLIKANDKLTLSLDVEAARNQSVPLIEPSYGFDSLHAKKYSDIGIPYKSSLIGNSVRDNIGSTNVFAGAEYKLSDHWTSNTIYSYNQQLKDAYNLVLLSFFNDTMANRAVYATRGGRIESYDLQQNFTGKITTGILRHRLLFGLEYNSYKMSYPYAYVSYDNINFTKPGTNTMSADKIDNLVGNSQLTVQSSQQYSLAAYASDVVNFTDNLIGMVSVRIDHFSDTGAKGYQQTAVSPKFGLVYQVVKNRLSLFANYMNGFQNQHGEDYFGNPFRPQEANQQEAGLKTDLLNGKLTGTVSYYDIRVKNILRADTAPGHGNSLIQDGSQQSKGFEAELTASLLPGLNLVAGYGYNENSFGKTDGNLLGKKPVESPRNTGNAWISYKLQTGKIKGLIFGFGMNFVSTMYSFFDTENLVPLPAYTVLRVTVGYDQPGYSIGLRVNNLSDRRYWNTNCQAQNPTQVTGTLSYKF